MKSKQTFVAFVFVLSMIGTILAGSATWKANPGSGDWNTASNWTPPTVPNGAGDIASFATSNITAVSMSAVTIIGSIVFDAPASAFTITVNPTITVVIDSGIINNSGITQNFVTAAFGQDDPGTLRFNGSATPGSLTTFRNEKPAVSGLVGGTLDFLANSNAGTATYINESGGQMEFEDAASAGNGIFHNAGGAASGERGGVVLFVTTNNTLTPTAANGTFINDGGTGSGAPGGQTHFIGSTPTAGNATLIANGGTNGGEGGVIRFDGRSTGGTARVEVFGNGNLDISPHGHSGVKVGSIEGDGVVFLGDSNLTVGSNGLSTTFSGKIKDGGIFGGSGGSLTKVNNDVLILTNANTYTGGTTLKGSASNRGSATLEVDNTTGSGTGSGPVVVEGGALRGVGIIAGPVTVAGTHNGPLENTFLAPGKFGRSAPGTLTIQNRLTLGLIATYQVSMTATTASKVVAHDVTVNNGANIEFTHLPHTTLPPGMVFTIIKNTSASPIAGTFLNLADGSTFRQFGNTYEANYEGGDGNDLTLTVQ
jgi:autotransporter-associated beta strand protein